MFFQVFGFPAVFGPNGPQTYHRTWTFQYRTPRSRAVSSNPRQFWAGNVLFTQLFGQFQVPVFPVHTQQQSVFLQCIFSSFLVFGRFRAERTSRAPWNLDVSVPTRPFSYRLVQSSRFLSRKRFLNPTFRAIPSCSFSRPKIMAMVMVTVNGYGYGSWFRPLPEGGRHF